MKTSLEAAPKTDASLFLATIANNLCLLKVQDGNLTRDSLLPGASLSLATIAINQF